MTDLLIPTDGRIHHGTTQLLEPSVMSVVGPKSRICFHSDELPAPQNILHCLTGWPNPRARRAMVLLTGVHVEFVGPVLFYDVDEATIAEIVEDLS